MVRLLVRCWNLDSGSIQSHLLMVVVRLLFHILVEADLICDHEGVVGLDDGCPDGCHWVDIGCHSSFSYVEGNLVAVESLLWIIGSRGTIVAPYSNGQWSLLLLMSAIG